MASLAEEIKQRKPFRTAEDEAYVNLVRTTTVLMRKEAEFLKQFELTPPQYNVLRILRGAGDEGLICREIGERMITVPLALPLRSTSRYSMHATPPSST